MHAPKHYRKNIKIKNFVATLQGILFAMAIIACSFEKLVTLFVKKSTHFRIRNVKKIENKT